MRFHRISFVLAGIAAVGCAQTLYRWNGYDDALYDHYKNPQQRERFVAKLAAVIQSAEEHGGVVPPGCYAEYGWALYEEGRIADAVVYFDKESKRWPESRALMEKLIRNATRGTSAEKKATPASAVEEAKK